MDNKFGKTSKLLLQAGVKNGKTILEDVFFTSPFKIMLPFYMNEDFMTIMCMSSSAGIMAGDVQEHTILVKEGAKLEYVSQEYEKIHKMDSGFAKRTIHIQVEKNGTLYYTPLPTIPFKDSAFESVVDVHLADSTSGFVMKEILSAGRCARGEKFLYRYYHNLVTVFLDDQLIYRDNTKFDPNRMELNSIGMYENHTHLGTLLLFNIPKGRIWIEEIRNLLQSQHDMEGGLTTIENKAIIIRVLGYHGEKIDQLFDKIINYTI